MQDNLRLCMGSLLGNENASVVSEGKVKPFFVKDGIKFNIEKY